MRRDVAACEGSRDPPPDYAETALRTERSLADSLSHPKTESGVCVLDGIERSERQPANIFVIKQSGAEVVKVVDFGIATQTGGQNSARLTAPGMVLGTAEYMAPEQAQGQPVDHRLDQYALGCIMWE